jgi:hypothetical protein
MAKKKMKSSLSTVIITAGLMMFATVSVHAESKGSGSNHPYKLQSRQVAEDVSAGKYRKTYPHNKRDLRSALRLYSENAAASMGLPKKAGQLAGGAAGVAASLLTNHGVNFGLNDKHTFSFEVRDPVDNDRVLYLSYKLKW